MSCQGQGYETSYGNKQDVSLSIHPNTLSFRCLSTQRRVLHRGFSSWPFSVPVPPHHGFWVSCHSAYVLRLWTSNYMSNLKEDWDHDASATPSPVCCPTTCFNWPPSTRHHLMTRIMLVHLVTFSLGTFGNICLAVAQLWLCSVGQCSQHCMLNNGQCVSLCCVSI